MGYTPAPPGSRLFLDFTRDQFCGKVLDRSGMCGEPAVLEGKDGKLPSWNTRGLSFDGIDDWLVVKNNDNINLTGATPQKPIIWWFDFQLYGNNDHQWFVRKPGDDSVVSQYGLYYNGVRKNIVLRLNSATTDYSTPDYIFANGEICFFAITWDGLEIRSYKNGRYLSKKNFSTTLTPTDSNLVIGNRDVGGPTSVGNAFIGEMYQCGITVGCTINELFEWHRKHGKTGGNTLSSAVTSQGSNAQSGDISTPADSTISGLKK